MRYLSKKRMGERTVFMTVLSLFFFIGAVKRMNVCTRCLRSGNVQRAVPKTHTDEVGA